MTGRELGAALKSLGLSGAAFAERIGVDPHTVSRWHANQRPVPGYAGKFIELLRQLAEREEAISDLWAALRRL